MSNVVSNVIGAIAMFIACLSIWKNLFNSEIDFFDFKFYLIALFAIFIIILNYFYNIVFFRIIFITAIMFICNKLIFSMGFKETILSTVLSEFVVCFSDLLFGICVIYILKIDLNMIPQLYGTIFANLFVLSMCIIISKFKIFKKIYCLLMSFLSSLQKRKIIIFSLLSIISLNFFLALTYFKLNTYYLLIIDTFMIFIYSYVIIKNLETSSKNEIMEAKNSSLIMSLHQYEDMVDRQRVENHENKNQLLIIKNMINKKDRDVIKYIDTVIKDKKEDDEILYTRVKTIPSGGLQGIIYQKMLVMKDNNILFSLDVSRDIRKINLDSLSIDDNYRLCKIIGVLLDNAIDASNDVKDKCIMISLYVDDDMLVVDISNRFSGKIDFDKLDDEGYTSKGDGHGYGLCLVKKILSETDIFENERSIKKDIFKQVVKVKIKNT